MGHMELNWVVSQRVSYATWGTRTGCDAGQGPAFWNASFTVLYMCDWWSGLSTFLPSQHLLPVSNTARVLKIKWHLRGEVVDSHDTAGARRSGEIVELWESSALVLKADELQARPPLRVSRRAANGHPEALIAHRQSYHPAKQNSAEDIMCVHRLPQRRGTLSLPVGRR